MNTDLAPLLRTLEDGLLERDVPARLVLLAAVAGEHVLLLGPPGTAKSELARRLQSVLPPGAGYFERLLTRFSTPEELFGPLSLKALEEDRYERLVQGYLPTAQVAFLDEVFKANSAILNALLTLLNERLFDNGAQRLTVPLVTVVGASNEVPSDEALLAFHDRFLLRVPVEPVGESAFEALMAPAPPRQTPTASPLQASERRMIQERAERITFSADCRAALQALRTHVQARGIRVSDRRWRQFGGLLRLAVAAEGSPEEVTGSDLWLAAFVVAAEPAHTAELLQWWRDSVLQVGSAECPGLTRTVEAFEKQLELETHAQAEEGADGAGKMALARAIGTSANSAGSSGGDALGEMGSTGTGSQALRLYSERAEAALRKRWSPLHIRARGAQVQEQLQQVRIERDTTAQQFSRLQSALQGRLWLAPSLAEAALAAPRGRLALLNGLIQRLERVAQGFADLPVDASQAEESQMPPAPVALAIP